MSAKTTKKAGKKNASKKPVVEETATKATLPMMPGGTLTPHYATEDRPYGNGFQMNVRLPTPAHVDAFNAMLEESGHANRTEWLCEVVESWAASADEDLSAAIDSELERLLAHRDAVNARREGERAKASSKGQDRRERRAKARAANRKAKIAKPADEPTADDDAEGDDE